MASKTTEWRKANPEKSKALRLREKPYVVKRVADWRNHRPRIDRLQEM